MLSLDTSTIIDIMNGRSPVTRRRFYEARSARETFVVSTLVLHELSYGAAISARPGMQTELLAAALDDLPIAPFTATDAEEAARVRLRLRAAGRRIGLADTLIAGQALARGWSVVTANVKDFRRIDGLSIIDWSSDGTI